MGTSSRGGGSRSQLSTARQALSGLGLIHEPGTATCLRTRSLVQFLGCLYLLILELMQETALQVWR